MPTNSQTATEISRVLARRGIAYPVDFIKSCDTIVKRDKDNNIVFVLFLAYYPEEHPYGLRIMAAGDTGAGTKALMKEALTVAFSRPDIFYIYTETSRDDIRNYLSRLGFEFRGITDSGEHFYALFYNNVQRKWLR